MDSNTLKTARLLLALAALSLAGVGAEAAQAPPSPHPSASPATPAATPDSPRESVTRYLDLCRSGRFKDAAEYLDLEDEPAGSGPRLARELKAVLDRHLWLDLDALSPLASGDAGDSLPEGVDQIGTIPSKSGRKQPVRIVRVGSGDEAHWAFSRATVAQIDAWYDALGDRFLRDHLPEVLLLPGPKELLWWQWLALPFLFLLAWLIGHGLGRLTRSVAGRIAARTSTTWDDELLKRVAPPLTLGWGLVAAAVLVQALDLYAPAESFLLQTLAALGILVVVWALWRSVDLVGTLLTASAWARESASARSLLLVGMRAGKVMVAALGLIAALSQLGYPVASLLAGLGLGGLALALAAQKTVENLFGSVSLAVDQPFRVGDFVHVEDFVGTVEAIGLRSTRFRTLDRTLISIPNGRVADMRLESFAARDRLRLACTIGLVYETSGAQMRQVLQGLEGVLRAHPKIWPDAVVVKFSGFGASSLDVDIMAWFQTSDWGEFQGIRQEVLLSFMDVVEKAGSSFAFPTRTVHMVNDPAPEPRP
jgi:MscS family membrane protein